MAFISGTIVLDTRAAALNNSNQKIPYSEEENSVAIKFIRSADGKTYPYISAQAFRYWLRTTLEKQPDLDWKASHSHREEKVAYTSANPLEFYDDDLFGYMRATSYKPGKEPQEGEEAASYQKLTPLEEKSKGDKATFATVTRVSPFRVGTLVALSPINIVNDFNSMTRHDNTATIAKGTKEGPVPYEHQFAPQTRFMTLFSLDIGQVGTFTYRRRSGYQNLDSVRKELAEEWVRQGYMEHLETLMTYRFFPETRTARIKTLFYGLGRLEGGAKQATHYEDVLPAVTIAAVLAGGVHPFNYLFSESKGAFRINLEVLERTLEDAADRMLSPVFAGWKPGFAPEEEERLRGFAHPGTEMVVSTPRRAYEALGDWIEANRDCLDE